MVHETLARANLRTRPEFARALHPLKNISGGASRAPLHRMAGTNYPRAFMGMIFIFLRNCKVLKILKRPSLALVILSGGA